MALGKKSNWSILKGQDKKDSLKYLDVHERQQLERSSLPGKKDMTAYTVVAGVLAFLAFLLVWVAVSLWDMAHTGGGELEMSSNPAATWFHVNEHYVNVNDPEDKITVSEYNSLVGTFAKAEKVPEVPDPGDPPVYQSPESEYIFDVVGHKETPWYSQSEDKYISQEEYDNLVANYESIYQQRVAQYEKDMTAYRAYRASVDDPAEMYKHQNEHYRNAYNPEEYVLPDAYASMVEDYDKLVRRGKLTDDEENIPVRPIKLSQFYAASAYGPVPVKTEFGASQWSTPDGNNDNNGDGNLDGSGTGQDLGGAEGEPDIPVSSEEGDGQSEADGSIGSQDGSSDVDDGSTQDGNMSDNTEGSGDSSMGGSADGNGGSSVGSTTDGSDMDPREVYLFDIIGHRDAPWMNQFTNERITNEQMEALCNAWDAFHGDAVQSNDSQQSGYEEPVLDVSEKQDGEPEDVPEGMEYAPIEYRNIYDGSTITYVQYDAMEAQYQKDLEAYKEAYTAHREQYHADDIDGTKKIFSMSPTMAKFLISMVFGMAAFGILYAVFKKMLDAQNLMSDTTDINQYYHDQHVALPEEVQQDYDWFPDVGAHSDVQVSSMISHMALSNKGLKKVMLARRADKDIRDENGDIDYHKGEMLMDADGNYITDEVPMIDEKFMEDLFEASGALKDKDVRVRYDATKIPYNPDGSNRDKLGKFATVADLINSDWEFPLYEPQRPGGAYIVDTAPVNTMVLAITRAGKGQTVIEPTLDMWMREKRPNNMVVNDPKGELLVKNYVRATVRGLQVVQFNLINAMKTDIYNPLAMAADAAREGDNTKCAMYVENIAEVFFPLDGGEDPVWPNAANNAFKRAAYGLIDYYLEEEKAMRRLAERTSVDEKVLEQKIDEMWGKVTLYNCYQLFVQLSSKKMKNPAVEFSAQAKAGKFNDLSDEEYQAELARVKAKSALWEDKPDADLLTLFFAATDALPRNSMRTLVANANNALKAMGGAEKMMSSCERQSGQINKPDHMAA